MNRLRTFCRTMTVLAAVGSIWCESTSLASGRVPFEQLQRPVQDRLNHEINALKTSLALQGLTWEAGYTQYSLMSDEELCAYFNLQWPPEEDESIPWYRGGETKELPAHFDWRDKEGKNFVTRPKNQGGCGSCWAFSATGVFESVLGIALKDASWHPNLAEQILVSCSTRDNGCGGGGLSSPLEHLVDYGTQFESCMGYQAKNGTCSNACGDYREQPILASSSFKVSGRDEIKRALMEGPLNVGFTVYSDYRYYKGGVYRRSQNATKVGGHAVVLIGWDDDDQAWIIKNSAGTNWGEDPYGVVGKKGYFRMGWGECGIDNRAFGLEIDVSCPECTDLDGDGFVDHSL